MVTNLQPYRVSVPTATCPDGLLTGYYETHHARQPGCWRHPHRAAVRPGPDGTRSEALSTSRRDIDTRAEALAALREIHWLADPIDALILEMQGLRAFTGHRRRMAGAWCAGLPPRTTCTCRRGAHGCWIAAPITDASWPAIKTGQPTNPHLLNDMLWNSPRTVFFKERPSTAGGRSLTRARGARRAAHA